MVSTIGCYGSFVSFERYVMAKKKINDFCYVLNDAGQIDYVLVDIWSPKYGLKQMPIDFSEVELLKDGAIHLHKDKDKFYAAQWVNGKCIKFHRRLFPDIKPNEEVLHGDDTLDNRRSKVKVGTKRENQRDRKCHRDGHLYGTYFDKERNKYQASIQVNKKRIRFGRYETKEEAHMRVLEFELSNEHLFE
jgi:hypothetical protein